ncbi:MAG: hypothetical protein KC416_16045, partial [Myxococcales bacterium]|nr:hypothetical protein [Myxococcales bacterium]
MSATTPPSTTHGRSTGFRVPRNVIPGPAIVLAWALLHLVSPGESMAQDAAGDTGAASNASAGGTLELELPPSEEESGAEATLGGEASAGDGTNGEAGAANQGGSPEAEDGHPDAASPAGAPVVDPWERKFRYHNTLLGSVGGFRVIDAGSGAEGSFRLQLHTEFFFSDGFLNTSDDQGSIGGALSLSVTPLSFLEIFASITTRANSNTSEQPNLFQVLGDTFLGIKGFYSVLPWLTVGGDVEVALLNSVGDIGLSFDGTGVGLRGNVSADFRELQGKNGFPLISRLNLQYYFDNSSNLISGTEDARYAALANPAPRADENRHLLSRVERFALQINRTDFVNIGLGFEAPLRIRQDFFIHPLLEWTWGIPVNRQGYDCLFVPDPAAPSRPAPGDDSCLDREGLSAFPMDI